MRPLLFLLIVGSWGGSARAQCDTARFAVEVREMEALIWSDYPKAIARAEELVGHYVSSDGWCRARALLALAKTEWVNGDYAQSLATLDRAQGEAERVKDPETVARAHYLRANNYYFQGYYDSAEFNFLRSKALFVTLGHTTGLIEVLHDMALMYHRRGDFAQSIRYLLELEKLKEAEPDFIHYVGDFTGITNYFIDTLYYRGVIADEARLYRKFSEEKNRVGVYQSLINLAIAYRELGDHRKAAWYADRGSRVMSENGYYPFWYLAAKEYGLAGMRDSCFFFHRLALGELGRATRIKVATTYAEIARSHLQFNALDSALKYLKWSFDLSVAMNNRITLASLHAELADVYNRLGRPEEAFTHLHLGIALARQVSVKHTATLYTLARDLYARRNDHARAYLYANLYQKLADSINRNENAMELIRFQAQMETSRKEKELEATRLKLRNRTITLVSVVLVAALSVAFMVVFYFQRRRIKHQNIQLNDRNQEQRALLQEIHHRVKNNLQYIVSLLNLQGNAARNPEEAAHIEEIKNRIMTMGVIHQRLYQVQGVHRVDVAPFVHELVSNLLNASPAATPIARDIRVESMQLDADSAISLGLLINELMTNAMKHAFARHSAPQVSLSITREEGGMHLSMRDNGPGFQFPGNGNGFGMKLIQLLLRKLKGRITQPDMNTVDIRFDLPVA